MNLKEISDFVKEIGFPMFVAIYLLVRTEPILQKLNNTMYQLLEYLRESNGLRKKQREKEEK